MAAVRMPAVRAAVVMLGAVLLGVFAVGKCTEQVPLLLWTSNGFSLPPRSDPAAGHTVSVSELQSCLSSAFSSAPHNVLLFFQDKLSVDDFTKYAGVFGNKQGSAFPNLETTLQSSSSLLLPSVSSSASASLPTLLQDELNTAPLYMDPDTLAQLRLNASLPALLVFSLPYSSSGVKSEFYIHTVSLPELSVDDFTKYAGVFGNKQGSAFPNLETTLQSSSSLLLPSVSSSASASLPTLLQDELNTAPLYMDPDTLAQLRLNASLPALLVFSLPYSSSGADMMSVKEVLSGNDEVIGQVLRIMGSQSVPYTAIYTALRPSRVIEESFPEVRSVGSRSLLQYRREGSPAPYAPVEFKERGSTCILLWAKNLTVSEYRSGKWERHNLSPKTFGEGVSPKLEGSSCNATHSRLVLHYEHVLNYRSFKLVADMMSVKEVLSGNDEVIGQVLRIMGSQSVPYTAIYTALRPSRVIEESFPEVRSVGSRSLLQYRREGSPAPYAPVEFKERGSTCILLWAKNLTVSEYRSGKWERHNLSPKTFGEGVSPKLEGSSCNATHSRLVLHYEHVLNYRSFKLVSLFPRQIQGFNVTGREFSYASDCAGFFTPGIWMGLLTSALMVLLLTYGLHMIMQLHTMDRFDDPKGPAISVPQTE
ncbi:hypothetical protein PGIGA_G00070020 [Pangasianodon gigas]|uniref:Uncharacterized protein n=1 Tax=Pangasianodon gigas TaxID=30993 RepID=A0ACC5X7N0_PANGG|nr:hypothetical protein [Pangasianodon gigas]